MARRPARTRSARPSQHLCAPEAPALGWVGPAAASGPRSERTANACVWRRRPGRAGSPGPGTRASAPLAGLLPHRRGPAVRIPASFGRVCHLLNRLKVRSCCLRNLPALTPHRPLGFVESFSKMWIMSYDCSFHLLLTPGGLAPSPARDSGARQERPGMRRRVLLLPPLWTMSPSILKAPLLE